MLQETKLASVGEFKLQYFIPRATEYHALLPTIGIASGTISAAHYRFFNITNHQNHTFSTTINLSTTAHPAPIAITNVYAPSNRSLKLDFLNKLLAIKQEDHIP